MTTTKPWRVVSARSLDLPRKARGFVASVRVPADVLVPFDLEQQSRWGILGVLRSRSEPVIMVELDIPLESHEGEVTPAQVLDRAMGPMDVVLDARSAPAAAIWRYSGDVVRLSVDEGRVQLEVSESVHDGFEPWPSVELPEVPSPDVEASLVAAGAVAEWLQSEVRTAAEGTAVQRAGALALLARYHSVPLRLSLEGRGLWPEAIARWRALPTELRVSVVQHALFSAAAIGAELDVLDSLVGEPTQAAAFLAQLCVRRDDLESLALLSEKAGEPQSAALRSGVGATDRRAIVAATAFPRVDAVPERLEALSWIDPAAWWSIPQ